MEAEKMRQAIKEEILKKISEILGLNKAITEGELEQIHNLFSSVKEGQQKITNK